MTPESVCHIEKRQVGEDGCDEHKNADDQTYYFNRAQAEKRRSFFLRDSPIPRSDHRGLLLQRAPPPRPHSQSPGRARHIQR